jgi:hypothetical protein
VATSRESPSTEPKLRWLLERFSFSSVAARLDQINASGLSSHRYGAGRDAQKAI